MEPEIRYYPELESTNEFLSGIITSGEADEGLVVSAGSQTQGKGHAGNTWLSEPGKICYSVSYLGLISSHPITSLTFQGY